MDQRDDCRNERARILLAAGLPFGCSLGKANPARFLGAPPTYICGLVLAAAVVASQRAESSPARLTLAR
jgi:hypothetical protein